MSYVLEKTHALFFEAREFESSYEEDGRPLGFMAGVIRTDKVNILERMLWIVSRGNVFLRRADIEEEIEDPRTVI